MGNKISLAKLPFAKPFTSLENVTQRLNLSFPEPDYAPETVANILRVLNDGPDEPDYFTEDIILLEVVGYYICSVPLNRNTNPLDRAIKMGSINAMTTLGLYYTRNKTTYDKGITLLMQAVEHGHVFALHNLVLVYSAKLDYDRYIKAWRATPDTEPAVESAGEDPVIKFITEHLDMLDVVPQGKSVINVAFGAKATYYKVICKDTAKYNEAIEAGIANNSMTCKIMFAKDCLEAKDEARFMSIMTELVDAGNIQAMYEMGDYYNAKNDKQRALGYLKMIWDIDPYYNLRSICSCRSCMKQRIHNNGMSIPYHTKLINIPKLMDITPTKLVQLCVNAGHKYLGNHTPGTQALYYRLTEGRVDESPEIPAPDNKVCPNCQQELLDPAESQISQCNKYNLCTECYVKSRDNMYCCRPCYMKGTDWHRQLIKDVTEFIKLPDLANRLCYWSDIGAWVDGFIPPESGMEYPVPVNSQIRSLVKYTARTSSFKVRLEHIKKCIGMSGTDELADDIKNTMQKIRKQLAETFCSSVRYSNLYIDNTYIGVVELIDCFGKDAYYHIIDIQGHALFDSFIDFKKHNITDPETNMYIDTIITKGEKDRVRINNNSNLFKAYSIRHFKLDISAI